MEAMKPELEAFSMEEADSLAKTALEAWLTDDLVQMESTIQGRPMALSFGLLRVMARLLRERFEGPEEARAFLEQILTVQHLRLVDNADD